MDCTCLEPLQYPKCFTKAFPHIHTVMHLLKKKQNTTSNDCCFTTLLYYRVFFISIFNHHPTKFTVIERTTLRTLAFHK